MSAHPHAVVLEGLPARLLEAAMTYLSDMLRECQLMLVDHDRDRGRVRGGDAADVGGQGSEGALDVVELAESLVPDLEEIRDLFHRARTTTTDGTCRVDLQMHVGHAGTLAHLQMQLVHLRFIGRRGGLLVESDPNVTQFLTWLWDETSDQLHGRDPRPYRMREI